jgi:NADH dehydrogenase
VFVCGDLAHVEEDGRLIPGVAQPAMQMGAYVAKRIARLTAKGLGTDGSGIEKGFHYFDKGDMALIEPPAPQVG